MLKQIFNYYMVIKSCWIILLFQLIGFIALVVFEQGVDILRSLHFAENGIVRVHSWATLFAVLWWSWQSWRSARAELHFTTFDFIQFNKRYALRAQVLVPRILAIVPILIFAAGLYKADGWNNPLIYLYLCLAVWLYIFLHLRKDLILYFLTRNKWKVLNIPDYVLIKNEAYPASFIWAKQGKWISFRLILIIILFTFIVLYPVTFPQYIGSAAIVLFALGSWLVISTFLDFAEKHYRFPFAFTLIIMVISFSFFNNNHKIRTIQDSEIERPNIEDHYIRWIQQRQTQNDDSIPVILVAAQGGGVRSSYWTAQVLSEMQTSVKDFDKHTYAYSTVSGGTLGVATYKSLLREGETELHSKVHRILSKDFLSPVTSWLVVPDLVQKFLPFPIYSLDRAKALEYSWEEAARIDGKDLLSKGFINSTKNDDCVYLYNSTHAENGFTTLISNVKVDPLVFNNKEDLFDVIRTDIPQSTAVSLSSRFPFLTPPAQIIDYKGRKWGNIVDGGYVENMGASSMLELYDYLKLLSAKYKFKTKFYLVFIKNTKAEYSSPITGLYEILAPLNTFSKVWVNSGNYSEHASKLKNLDHSDEAIFVTLDRRDDQLIPLGWFLSKEAINNINIQLKEQTQHFKQRLSPNMSSNRNSSLDLSRFEN